MNIIDFTNLFIIPVVTTILAKIVETVITSSYEAKKKSAEVSSNDSLLNQLVLNEREALNRKKIIGTRNSAVSDILIKHLLAIKNDRKYEFKLSSLKKISDYIELRDNKLVLNDTFRYYTTIAALAFFNVVAIATFLASIVAINEKLNIPWTVLFQLIMFTSALVFILLTQEIQKLYVGRKLCNNINNLDSPATPMPSQKVDEKT
ncbi:hypothetical protein [Serratia surfactantfaciens]|uniref:hypothetical protein n=1 Tax=Serratia surfactantfaciens TaxID=2741499 RepID=UPI001B3C6825|nr:hypothetical protein [Serratia surfactantfaciens]